MASWLFVTVPLFFVFLWLLIRVAMRLVRATRASVVAELPLEPTIHVTLREPGSYALYGEGKRFSSDFSGLAFVIRDGKDRQIALAPVLMRTVVSSFDRVRLQLRSFSLSTPGDLTVNITGIRAGSDADSRIVIARPMLGTVVGSVLALIALGALTIASLGGSIAIIVLSR